MVRIDFTGVEELDFDPMPKGNYPAMCSAAEYIAESKNSGEPTIAWEFTVREGEYEGRKAFLNTSLQQQAKWASKRVMKALGADPAMLEGEFDFESGDYEGNDCVIVIGHETFEGLVRQRVRRVLPSTAQTGAAPF